MKSVKLIRWAGLASIVGGVLWTVMFLSRLPDDLQANIGNFNGLNFIPLALFLPGVVVLHKHRAGVLKRTQTVGFVLTFAGLVLSIVLNLIGLSLEAYFPGMVPPQGSSAATTFDSVYYGANVALVAGMLLLGIVFFIAKALPRWNDAPLVVGLLGALWTPLFLWDAPWSQTIVTFSNATLLVRAAFGVGWALLGYALWTHRDEAVPSEADGEPKNLVLGPRMNAAVAKLEKDTEWLVGKLQSIALFDLLEIVGKLTILVAVILFLIGIEDRRKQKSYEAWQVINSAQGQEGTGGRIDALQTLSNANESLEGVVAQNALLTGVALKEGTDLDNARLRESDLTGASLQTASLTNADLDKTTLVGARLDGANLTNASLREVNLSGAQLPGAVLSKAKLNDAVLSAFTNETSSEKIFRICEENPEESCANLEGADLIGAELENTDLRGANLQDTKLGDARLINTRLDGADLTGADLTGANLENASLDGAVLNGTILAGATLNTDGLVGARLDGADFGDAVLWGEGWGTDLRYETDLRRVEHLTEEQIKGAKGDETTLLPDGIERSPGWATVTNNLPDLGPLTEGAYSTEEFKPEFSFSPGEGWEVSYSEVQNAVAIWNEKVGSISILNVDEVYDPQNPNTGEVLKAPEDVQGMVKWFQDHPHLNTLETGPVRIGGMTGVKFDVTANAAPEGYTPDCENPCLPPYLPSRRWGNVPVLRKPVEPGDRPGRRWRCRGSQHRHDRR